MKTIKKVIALILSLGMLLSLGIVSSAATPKETDTATISVTNVEAGATVRAYQIVKASYNESALTGYKKVEGVDIADLTSPSAVEVSQIASNIISGSISPDFYELTFQDSTYSASVSSGLYLVLVTKTDSARVYNPMLVAARYNPDKTASDNELEDGNVDSLSKFTNNAYAKSTEVKVDKTIIDTNKNDKGNTVSYGDTVDFKVESTIPSYSDIYKNVLFKVSDSLSEGLILENNLKITILGTQVEESDDTFTITKDDHSYSIDFNSNYIKENGLANLVITYSAKVSDNAAINFNPNTNKATIEYTNHPNETTGKTEDKTYTYTFGIDAMLNGQNGIDTKKTSEIIKVDENGNVEKVDSKIETDSIKVTSPLGQAVFGLFADEDCTNEIMSATTSEDGRLEMVGLNDGTYYLKETQAPGDYKVDSTVHKVVIDASLNEDGTLESYIITIDEKATSTYVATYDNGVITKIDSNTTPFTIINAKLPALPSTGGIGTYLFYIIGSLLIVCAIVLIIRRVRLSK